MAFHIVLPSDFTVCEVASLLLFMKLHQGEIPSYGSFPIRFTRRSTAATFAPGAHPIGVRINIVFDQGYLEAVRESGIGAAYERLVEKLMAETSRPKRSAPQPGEVTPNVPHRLPEFIRGRLLALPPGSDRLRREVLDDALALLGTAVALLSDEGQLPDVFDFVTLRRAHSRRISDRSQSLSEDARLSRIARVAFQTLQQDSNSYTRARRDLHSAQSVTMNVIGAERFPDGTIRFHDLKNRQVVIGRSSSVHFPSVARSEGRADVVVQVSPSENRILVVARSDVHLTHLAAFLRNADAAARLGAAPQPTEEVCDDGCRAPAGAVGVFDFSASERVVGNLDPHSPPSALRRSQLITLVRTALAIESSPALRAVGALPSGDSTALALAAAMMP